MYLDQVIKKFNKALSQQKCGDANAQVQAAAILVLAEAILEAMDTRASQIGTDELSHAICLGMRYALFGTDASSGSSIIGLPLDVATTQEVQP